MLLSVEQIYVLFDRLKWEPVYEDEQIVVAKKRRGGYSNDPTIAQIEAALSIMGEAKAKVERAARLTSAPDAPLARGRRK